MVNGSIKLERRGELFCRNDKKQTKSIIFIVVSHLEAEIMKK